MAKTKDKGIIKFSYDADTVFNDVCLLSSYMTKNISSESGSLMDEYCITEDERDIYNECLKHIMPDIYDVVIGVVPCVDDAISETNGINISLKDNHSYNVNVLTLIDTTLSNCIKYGVLSDYYSICVQADLYSMSKSKFEENLLQLKQRLLQLKKRTVSAQF